MKHFIIAALLLSAAVVSFAQQYDRTEDFDIVVLNNDGINERIDVCITGYRGTNTVIRIPLRFNRNHVTEIWDKAFAGKKITSVIIPDSIYDIAWEAFANNALTEIAIPNRVIIGGHAFRGNYITQITIGSNVFLDDEKNPSFELGFDDFFRANKCRAGIYTYKDGKWSAEYGSIKEDEFDFDIVKEGDSLDVFISGYRGNKKEIQIPGHFGSFYVTDIGKNAFAGKGLTGIDIPLNVYKIGDGSFANNLLTHVAIPESVYLIGHKAFAGNKITNLIIPDGSAICDFAFMGNNITKIIVGLGVDIYNDEGAAFELGFDNFFEQNKKRAGTYVYRNGRWSVEYDLNENGFAANISADGKSAVIMDYFGFNTEISIPSRMGNFPVAEIGHLAFYGKGLTGVSIPGSINTIGEEAFAGNNLASVTINEGVNHIGRKAFAGNKIKSVVIPDSVKNLGNESFENNRLESVTIPSGINTITYRTFAGNLLADVTIPGNIKTISTEAFADNLLASVTIPNGVTRIWEKAFSNNRLTAVTISGSVNAIGNKAFSQNPLTSVTIPRSVTMMGESVFDEKVIVRRQ